MASREFVRLVEQLSQRVVDAPDRFRAPQRNEEWTKMVFIMPLLEGLGWDSFSDVEYEASPEEVEGALDFILCSQPRIGIEAKALDVKPPENLNHRQIVKGLKQSEENEASYFIWTNGDCWQFFSLSLPSAPIYSVTLSDAHDRRERIEQIADQLYLIEKESFSADPGIFDEAIRRHWKTIALPDAFDALWNEHAQDFLQLFRRDLPDELDITDEEILAFFTGLETPSLSARSSQKRPAKRGRSVDLAFPEDWQKLLDSYEPPYERARKRFRQGYYRKLAEHITRDQCSPWSKSTTWRHVGAPRDTNERKKLGPVVALFREWRFIEEAEGIDMYQRVQECVPYLRKLLEETA